MIVAMAVLTTTAMPPTLRWALGRIPMRKEEKQRLEREELEERGFVPNLERLLIAVDDSPNGKFASRVAGMLAGTHGMPATVLHIPDPSKIESTMPDNEESWVLHPKVRTKSPTRRKRSSGRKRQKEMMAKAKVSPARREKAVGEAVQQAAAQTTSKQKKKRRLAPRWR